LWDPEDVRRKVNRTKYRKSKINIHSADDSNEKKSRLAIDDHLLMSLLSNMIGDVTGASKYVDDRSKAGQVGVCLYCRVKLRREEVDPQVMKHCEFVCHDRVLRQGKATHVVVGITYGLEAFCVGCQPAMEHEDQVDVEERLRDWFENWRQCLLDEKETFGYLLEGVTCRLYTDLPSSTECALDVRCSMLSALGKICIY